MKENIVILDTNVDGEILIEKNSMEIINNSEEDLKVDFEIIAVASLKEVDIVVSADKRTMLSKLANETYDLVNKTNGLRTPKLVDYFEFKEVHLKC